MVRLESQLARTVLARNLKVRKGESVLIESWTHGLRYVGALVEETRRLGADPLVIYEDEGAWWNDLGAGRTRALGRMSRSERAALAAADVYVYLWGPEDRPRADALPQRIQGATTAFNDSWYRTGRKRGLRGCRLSVAFATDPLARQLGLDGARWRRQIATASLADAERMRENGTRLAKRLAKGRELRITSRDGTDVRLGLAGREPRVEVGLVDRAARRSPYGFLVNAPAGNVMVALDESTAEGTVVSNTPIVLPPGIAVRSGRWEFAEGRLVSYSYDRSGPKIEALYRAAGAGRDRPGLLSIGLNPKARKVPQYEEIESGVVLLGTGGNSFLGGVTRLPFQMYALLRGADVEIDSVPVVTGGRVA